MTWPKKVEDSILLTEPPQVFRALAWASRWTDSQHHMNEGNLCKRRSMEVDKCLVWKEKKWTNPEVQLYLWGRKMG